MKKNEKNELKALKVFKKSLGEERWNGFKAGVVFTEGVFNKLFKHLAKQINKADEEKKK